MTFDFQATVPFTGSVDCMQLAGSFLMFLAGLTVIGVLLSDLALAWLDPRIRLEGKAAR